MLHRILLADDHEVVRAGLKNIISQHADWSVCGEAGDGEDAAAKAIALRPDLVIMDITMPGLSGIAAARKIRDLVPTIKILILTMHDPTQIPEVLLASGADAFVSKTLPWPELAERINSLLNDSLLQNLPEIVHVSDPSLETDFEMLETGAEENKTRRWTH